MLKQQNCIYILILLLMFGCSTKKNTWTSRSYHNLTAHYNVYFNANESYKEGQRKIKNSVRDDYSKILPVFIDTRLEVKDLVSSEMERCIEKSTKLIEKHSIRKKPKRSNRDSEVYKAFASQNEFNKWVDNAYLLIGKASFLQQNYIQAEKSFTFMFREFRESQELYEAQIYYARCLIEQGDFASAELAIDNFDITGSASDNLYGMFYASIADMYMKQQQYDKAVPLIKQAAEKTGDKNQRARLYYILGQLNKQEGNIGQATANFDKVIKLRANYELTFNARMQYISVAYSVDGIESAEKGAKKLLRNHRNEEFKDQIYYNLGLAYLAENDTSLAIDNFNNSVKTSVSNSHQKGLSYYELSTINYSIPLYKPTYYYLDSAMQNVNEDFIEQEDIGEFHEILKDLVSNIEIVEREDSLQAIALMSESDRNAFIDDIINKKAEEEKRRKEEEAALMGGGSYYDPTFSSLNSSQSSDDSWYFYNQNSINIGKLNFERVWGKRKLEDNWRRINKDVVAEDLIGREGDANGLAELDSLNASSAQAALDNAAAQNGAEKVMTKEDYLKDLPLSDEDMKASNKKVENALMNEGLIYKDQLKDYEMAIETFNELLERYPHSIYREDALMNMYLSYDSSNNLSGKERIRKRLYDEFPNGEFTHYLQNPNYYAHLQERESTVDSLYQNAYRAYLLNNFDITLADQQKAASIDKNNKLVPKFNLISGLASAKLGDLKGFESNLNNIVNNYAESEENELATELLKQYKDGRMPISGPSPKSMLTDVPSESDDDDFAGDSYISYTINDTAKHSLIVLMNSEADFNRLQFNIADYNFSHFLLNDFEIESKQMPNGKQILEVVGLKNRIEAQDYFYSIRENSGLFKVNNMLDYKLYVITDENLKFLISSGDEKGYDKFYENEYLSSESFKRLSVNDRSNLITTGSTSQSTSSKPELVSSNTETKVKEIEQQTVKVQAQTDSVVVSGVAPVASTKADSVEVDSIEVDVPKFVFEEGQHSVVIIMENNNDFDADRLQNMFSSFANDNLTLAQKVKTGKVGNSHMYVEIYPFVASSDAKNAISKIKRNQYIHRSLRGKKYYIWAISPKNLDTLRKERNFEEYKEFYTKSY